jgi:hypothetical protein
MSDSIVVYRSRWEQERDEYFYNNPEIVLYFIAGVIVTLLLAYVASLIYDAWRRRR